VYEVHTHMDIGWFGGREWNEQKALIYTTMLERLWVRS
jgi:hypothetical protein